MTSCFPVCDETTGFIPPIQRGDFLCQTPLEIKKKDCQKFVCAPVFRGPDGPEGEAGPPGPENELILQVNNTCFVDPQFSSLNPPEIERMDRPFPDLVSALAAIPIGAQGGFWQIYLWPGEYTGDVTINQPNIRVDIRGSGVTTTFINGRVFLDMDGVTLTLTNLTVNNIAGRTIDIPNAVDDATIRIRDSILTAQVGDAASVFLFKGNGVNGEITVIDSEITFNSAATPQFVVSNSGLVRLVSNQINLSLGGTGRIFSKAGLGVTQISDNTINAILPNTNLNLHVLSPGSGMLARSIVNDNRHILTTVGSYTSTFNTYQGVGPAAVGSLLLGRNNEYTLIGDFSGALLRSASNDGSEVPIKIVDDTWPNTEPMPPPNLPSAADPDAAFPIQLQINTGNALATNQGIQFATREITADHTVNDDDFFIRAAAGATTVTFPAPSVRNRGKVVVIQNVSGVPLIITGAPGPIPTNQVRQYINDGAGGAWYIFTLAP